MNKGLKDKVLIVFSILGIIFLSSCLKDEKPVEPKDRGGVVTSQISVDSDYKYQIWYSLENDKIVAQNLKTGWDVRFSSDVDSPHIMLNTSRSMMAYYTGETEWSSVDDTSGFYENRKLDMPNGSKDSTAIGDWQNNSGIYIIDMGYDPGGLHLGYYKIQLLGISNDFFKFKYGNIEDTNFSIDSIKRDVGYHYVYFSLINNKSVNIEPRKNEYDLLFSQYTHLFYDPFMPYLVVGVLTNPGHQSTRLKANDFESITASDTLVSEMKRDVNVIGYDWKEFSFETNQYEVFSDYYYLIKSNTGFIYKLHFIDFYDENGQKGAPQFVFQAL